jgi:hypothetical protein
LLETPFNQAETAAVQDTQHLDTPSSVTRRHSFKESSDVKRKQAFHDSGSVDLGRRHSFKSSPDLQPWRNEASPRSDTGRSEHSISEVRLMVHALKNLTNTYRSALSMKRLLLLATRPAGAHTPRGVRRKTRTCRATRFPSPRPAHR